MTEPQMTNMFLSIFYSSLDFTACICPITLRPLFSYFDRYLVYTSLLKQKPTVHSHQAVADINQSVRKLPEIGVRAVSACD